jgi:uncharacterized cupin superfamily protein
MSQPILITTPATVELQPEAIPSDWILSGTPVARKNKLATSDDWVSSIVIWDCTVGRFHWHYVQDEAVFVISGEAFLINENGEERRFGAGDFGFFPAGTSCTWRVSADFRKVAVLREPMWRPLGFVLKVSKKLLRVVGILGRSPFLFALAAWTYWNTR